jgi:hypothetical protein
LNTRFACESFSPEKENARESAVIVLKTHGRHGFAHLVLGSVAEEVVRSAPCAVLTLTPTAQQKAAHLKMERRDVAS